MKENNRKVFIAADFGNSKLTVVAAEPYENGQVQILGIESISMPQNTMKFGIIRKPKVLSSNLKALIEKLQRSINQKGLNYYEIKSFYVGISGNTLRTSIQSFRQSFNKNIVITQQVLDEFLMKTKQALLEKNILSDEFISDSSLLKGQIFAYDFFPQSFLIDGVHKENPIGEMSKKLLVEYLVAQSRSEMIEGLYALKNELSGNYTIHKRLSLLSIGEAFLSDEERNKGVVLIDFGAQCTSMIVYQNNKVRYLSCVPLGGENITKDLSIMLNLSEQEAEVLKRKEADLIFSSDHLPFSDFAAGNTHISKREIVRIARERQLEILDFVEQHLESVGCAEILKRCTIITGGASKMTNLITLMEHEKQWNIRSIDFDNRILTADKSQLCPENALLFSLLLNATENCCVKEKKNSKILTTNKKDRGRGFFGEFIKMFDDEV